jgi:glucokinase
MKNQYVVGADIGGSHIGSCVVDLSTGTIVEASICHQPVNSRSYSAGAIVGTWSACITESIRQSGVAVAAAGVAMPGPFDYRKGISIMAGVDKYDQIFGMDVTASLLARLSSVGIRALLYTNDAAAFALGEALGGAAKGFDRVVALTLGSGLGSGFLAGGRLVTTGAGVPANGWVYPLPFENGCADDRLTTRWFLRRYKELTNKEATGVKDLADAAAALDAAACRVFEEYGTRLASFIQPISQAFGAQAIVLGGNIAKAYPLFRAQFLRRLESLGTPVAVRCSALHDKAAMAGAAFLFMNK